MGIISFVGLLAYDIEMDPDQELCLCFHVSLRKVQKFIRLENPRVASQLSQCYGAGTGCGWCRPFLKRLLEEAQAGLPNGSQGDLQSDPERYPGRGDGELPEKTLDLPDPDTYAKLREQYVRAGKRAVPSTPPPTPPN